jgi:hypothetical protein
LDVSSLVQIYPGIGTNAGRGDLGNLPGAAGGCPMAISANSAIGAAWPTAPKIMRQLTFTNPYRFMGEKDGGGF